MFQPVFSTVPSDDTSMNDFHLKGPQEIYIVSLLDRKVSDFDIDDF